MSATFAPASLATRDLILRPMELDDGGALDPALNDPTVREMFGWPADERSEGREWVQAQLDLQSLNGSVPASHYAWTMVAAEGGAMVGVVTLARVNIYEGGELTVFVHPDRRGAGYASQALDAVIDWAFDGMIPVFAITEGRDTGVRLPKLVAVAKPHNTASIAMLRKTKLHEIGLQQGRNQTTSQPEQVHVFSLERREREQDRATARLLG